MDEYASTPGMAAAMVRHHLAADSYKTRRRETFGEYASIMREIGDFLDTEVRLTIKDRLDLRRPGGLLQPRSRRGDCMMLMRNACNLSETEVFEKAEQAYEDVVQHYQKCQDAVLLRSRRTATRLAAQVRYVAAVAAV